MVVDARAGRPAAPSYNPRWRETQELEVAERSDLGRSDGSADEIEAQFYEALQRGDIDRLMAVWSDEDEMACVHPGGPRVVGATAIRASFEAIFGNGRRSPPSRRSAAGRGPHSTAVHSVLERVDVSGQEGRQSPGSSPPTST